jgi:DNA invertase Pin-like site-specific DNA recombinase
VNPRRLFLGTHADNIRDKVRKGRANQERENNNHSRVTRKTAAEIRRLKAERVPQRQIAQRFDISESLVSLIVNNKAWVD